MTVQTAPAPTIDLAALKAKQQLAWSSGDYARIGVTLQVTGEELAEALALAPDARALDVAAGNGNASLALARRWARVTSTDYVEALLEQGRRRAEAEALELTYRVADAEDLPFAAGEYDAVVSTFGVMFTPDQERAASELARVCRAGGRIGLACWTPEGFIGRLFGVIGKHVPPPAGASSPARWGTREWLTEQFGSTCEVRSFERKHFLFVYRSPEHFLDYFRTWYGPMQRAFAALDSAGQAALEQDVLDLVRAGNTARDGSLRLPSEYVEVVLTRSPIDATA